MPALDRRADANSPSTISPVYIAGICVIVFIVLAVGVWLGRRSYLKRQAAKDVGFLSVRGLVTEDGQPLPEKDQSSQPSAGGGFSRRDINSMVPMPQKTLSRPRPTSASRDKAIEHHRQSGIMPQSPTKPFTFALSASTSEGKRNSKSRQSSASFGSVGSRYSVVSVASSNHSSDSQSTDGAVRKVRQLFEPVLPDELLLSKIGEQLTIVQSFDDGWCVVGRENGSMTNTGKSMFKSRSQQESDVELGVIPAWCFIKPANGVRVERPVRSSSLGITVNLRQPRSRSSLVSWSNF